MKKNIALIVLMMTGVGMLFSCQKKDDTGGGAAGPLQITSFTPTAAASDSIITIMGTGFSRMVSDDVVTFGDKPAVVTAASATSLSVKVPVGAKDGKITVKVGTQAVSAATDFSYVYTVTTLAGSGVGGNIDAKGPDARFFHPRGVTVDGSGNVFVSDAGNDFIRKVAPDGTVTSFVGIKGLAIFNDPGQIVVDPAGNVYVADEGYHQIQKITPDGNHFVLAGSGTPGTKNGIGTAAQFNHPTGIALDKFGNLYVADEYNCVIRKIDPNGVVSVVAGDITQLGGFRDGPAASAKFFYPSGIAVDDNINIYVTDADNHRIRKNNAAWIVSTLAGTGAEGFADGPGNMAKFDFPRQLTVDNSGNVFVADYSNNRIRKITPDGVVSTIAGISTPGFVDGAGGVARFYDPAGITVDADGTIYVADFLNNCIRKVR
jgi:sugar lactone lactonase YvrE